MPGLFGYWMRQYDKLPSTTLLQSMANSMQHSGNLKTEINGWLGFGAGRVHLSYFQPNPQPATDSESRFFLWIDGEITNFDELVTRYEIDKSKFATETDLVLYLILEFGWHFLQHVDGIFNLVLYDQERHQVTVVNDRFGFRPLYWVETPLGFGYGGELKALLQLPGTQSAVDPLAVDEWFSFGYLLGNRTWIEGIQLFPPATIMQVSDEVTTSERYRSWYDSEPFDTHLSEEEIIEELGRLWIQAVARMVDDKRLGQFLSGGLDSRAILAALPPTRRPFHTFTLGVDSCEDVTIARQVTSIKGVPHNFVEITAENWLQPRIDAVWRTDGMGKILDLHGAEAIETASGLIEVSLHGSLGDGIVGGGYLFPLEGSRVHLEKFRAHHRLIPKTRQESVLESYLLLIKELGSAQAHYIEQRQRRFINNGIIMSSAYWETRFPFAEGNFLDFVLRLPVETRGDSNIYNKMLLKCFPDFFSNVPRQGSGLPISAPAWRHKTKDMTLLFERVLRFTGGKAGMNLPPSRRDFTNYPLWLRVEPARSFLVDLLLDENALYTQFVDARKAREAVSDFLNSQLNRNLNTVNLLLTFEIYLLQLFDHARLTKKRANIASESHVA